jgi:hypothetical protein
LLETKIGWRGVLAEPDSQWHDALHRNRPLEKIISDCIYSQSGYKIRFISSSNGVYSSLKNHTQDDANKPLGGNSKERLTEYKEIDVMTFFK